MGKYNKNKLRYAICKICREKWNIPGNQDTAHGYICPNCSQKGMKNIAYERRGNEAGAGG